MEAHYRGVIRIYNLMLLYNSSQAKDDYWGAGGVGVYGEATDAGQSKAESRQIGVNNVFLIDSPERCD